MRLLPFLDHTPPVWSQEQYGIYGLIRSKHTKHDQLQKSTRTTFTLYFSTSYSKKYKVRQIWISGENILSGSTAPHTHKDLKETLENTINAITQLDKYCINPGI